MPTLSTGYTRIGRETTTWEPNVLCLVESGIRNIADNFLDCLPAVAVVLLGHFQSFSVPVPCPASCFQDVRCVCYPLVMHQDVPRGFDLRKVLDLRSGR